MREVEGIEVSLLGLEFPSPVLLASGVLGTSPGGLNKAARAGAGGVTTKSLGLNPREGHPLPAVVEVEGGYLNAMGLPNPGVGEFVDEISSREIPVPLLGSIYGSNADQFVRVAGELAPQVDVIELNLSCPHGGEYGSTVGTKPSLVEDITTDVKEMVDLPVLAKLTPNVSDITEMGKAAEQGGADGVVAVNTLSGMAIDIETRRPILGNESGGLSGPGIHPVAVAAVYDLYESLSIPILGMGGVDDGRALVEMMLAGASLVGLGTAIITEGMDVFADLNEFLRRYLERNDLDLEDMVGAAHRS
uniref:Dihydroorotate dehydrogenase family protein n=1 Tax=uncultured organism TaxID=155900 RepID=M1QA42_9ZZZZ|nr:dihydroorotate dehydrogenase family protein [uncultured organism]